MSIIGEILTMKTKISIDRLALLIGTLIICMGLICNAFQIISNAAFRCIVLAGIIVHGISLAIIFKQNQF